jgi:hypothetical protein
MLLTKTIGRPYQCGFSVLNVPVWEKMLIAVALSKSRRFFLRVYLDPREKIDQVHNTGWTSLPDKNLTKFRLVDAELAPVPG